MLQDQPEIEFKLKEIYDDFGSVYSGCIKDDPGMEKWNGQVESGEGDAKRTVKVFRSNCGAP